MKKKENKNTALGYFHKSVDENEEYLATIPWIEDEVFEVVIGNFEERSEKISFH